MPQQAPVSLHSGPMTSDEYRDALVAAKDARNQAMTENAEVENAGDTSVHDTDALRQTVEEAARAARDAGVDISDLVGDNVGVSTETRLKQLRAELRSVQAEGTPRMTVAAEAPGQPSHTPAAAAEIERLKAEIHRLEGETGQA